MTQEVIVGDIVIVGAGPAGLAAAIRLKQLKPDLHVVVLEKGAEVGSHILSGAVLDPRAITELLPQFEYEKTAAVEDKFIFLTQHHAIKLPTPTPLKNSGNFIISLSNFCKALGREAEKLGIEIYPGFAAIDYILDDSDQKICGIKTTGVDIHAKHVLVAEGARGSLSKKIIQKFNLDKNSDPQTYALGVKELWQIEANSQYKPGTVIHTVGWPLDHKTYGGSFIYFLDNNLVSIGFVVGLDYANKNIDPFQELQKFKTHPRIKSIFDHAKSKRIGYGARSLVEGGLQSLPELTFPGGLLIGDSAGFLNVPKIKGIHMALKSGMVAAESIISQENYLANLKKSWLWEELYTARNIRPSFNYGLIPGLILSGIDNYIFRGKAPWTFHHKKADYLYSNHSAPQITYPKADNKIVFDKSSSLFLSNIHHTESQPCHLILKDPNKISFYDYCPAAVYEIINNKLQINSQNCLHCKACDIKDPDQNITWVPPQGGSGPNYSGL